MSSTDLPPTVAIVLDPDFGSHLAPLSKTVPIWVVASDANKEVYKRLWASCGDSDHRKKGSITDFKVRDHNRRVQNFVDVFPTVELHHSLRKGAIIQLFGIKPEQDIINELQKIGFALISANDDIILARRVEHSHI